MNFSEGYLTNSSARVKKLDSSIKKYEPVAGRTMPSIDQLAVGEGRLFDLAVLFVDLVDCTDTISKLNLDQASRWLIHFLIESTRIIRDYGGQVEKYSGDRVLGLFGTEGGTLKDAATSALYCAVVIRCIVRKILSPFYVEKNLPKAEVKIGMDFGQVKIDKVGIRGNSELSAIGTTVNIASKLENIAKPNEILIGNELFKLLEQRDQGFSSKQVTIDDWGYHYDKSEEVYSYYLYNADYDSCK